MLLTLTTTHRPATDLGYLLVKHPARVHSAELSFGKAHLFYPEATEERCTAALLLDVDPVGIVREGELSDQYVNDRPWVASSFLSVAMGRLLRTAMTGESKDRPALAATPIPLVARLPSLPCRGGEALLRELFEPLGYTVTATNQPLGAGYGPSRIHDVTLTATLPLSTLLGHLYVLVPVLDDHKHYWVGEDEVEKLLRRGEGWLAEHPRRDLIVRRYLRHRARLTRHALARLVEGDPDAEALQAEAAEEALEAPLSLDEQRRAAVLAELRLCGAKRVLDLGCGEGRLVRALLDEAAVTEVVGVDASVRALEVAARRLERVPERRRERAKLLQGALGYRDTRLVGFDAAAVVEVIEHLDPPRLDSFTRALFGHTRPQTVVLTTPNVEYNALFPDPGALRHRDHRFEWTRAQFRAWAEAAAEAHGYRVRFEPVGAEHEAHGPPTQMGVFTRCA